jgi:predicted nucleic acid-binding protein
LIAYADTSFLASLYGEDAGSLHAIAEYEAAKPTLVVTAVGEFEFLNAFESRVFRKESSPAEVDAYFRAFGDDIRAGLLTRKGVPVNAYERAMLLARHHTRQLGARSMDILHVAIALEVGAHVFFTFDRVQRRVARAAGLTVRPVR